MTKTKKITIFCFLAVTTLCKEQNHDKPEEPVSVGEEAPESEYQSSDEQLQDVYHRLSNTNWSGQIDASTYWGISISQKHVTISYPEIRQSIKGRIILSPGRIEMVFSGKDKLYFGSSREAQYNIQGDCSFGQDDHPFKYQSFLECHWSSKCSDPEMLLCSTLPDSLRWFDPTSNKEPGQSAVIGDTEIVTLGLQKARTKQDVFVRTSPSVQAPHIEGILSCGDGFPDRYKKGNQFILIGRTLQKSEVLGTSDYWYYGIYWVNDCVSSWGNRGWIFGSLLE